MNRAIKVRNLSKRIRGKQVLKNIGYKVAFTTNGGKVKKGMDSFELPRVRILRDDSLSSFIAKVNN